MSVSLQIINADARRFSVRLVRTDDQLHIEFFDASSSQDEAYFTGVRCSVETLFARAFEDGSPADVLFNEDLPMWGISADNINDIQVWLASHLSAEELNGFAAFIQDNASPVSPRAETTPTPPAKPVQPSVVASPTSLPAILQQVLHLLDQAEQMDTSWQQGQVQLRLQLLTAKQESLRALAMFEELTK